MRPEQLALLGYVDIPFDILKMIDSGNGIHARFCAIDSLRQLTGNKKIRELLKRLDLYNIENV